MEQGSTERAVHRRPNGGTETTSRRRFLRIGSAAAAASIAGCSGVFGGPDTAGGQPGNEGGSGDQSGTGITLSSFRGSGANAFDRPSIEGNRIADLPDLSGELTIYLGGGEGGLYVDLLDRFREIYPEFTPSTRLQPTAQLTNTLVEELSAGSSPADVFWAVDAGSLGRVAEAGGTIQLPADVTEPVPENFHPDDQWVGTAGRARSVPYNTDQLTADDIPDTVLAFPDTEVFEGSFGWAPTYGAFQSFITAMRLLEGDARTREWLTAMVDHGVSGYPDEFLTSNAVADGEIGAGFANHYYALRVTAARPNAPIDLAFTSNDAGALINVAGAAVIQDTAAEELAVNFIRHLLSVEAQEFFATTTYAYPVVAGIPPVGGLPSIEELDPPEIDLTELADVQPTLELMRDVGVL